MPAKNNAILSNHFRKDWKSRVRTWFNQPGRKTRRAEARSAKAARIFPRPLGLLRPVVHCQTVKYNAKVREGRGFTLDELKSAGITKQVAKTIGIAVDYRRTNQSLESLQENVARLSEYKSKLVVFPRHAGKVKKGDTEGADIKSATQHKGAILPIKKTLGQPEQLETREITPREQKTVIYRVLRKSRKDVALQGNRAIRAKKRAAAAADGPKKEVKGKKK